MHAAVWKVTGVSSVFLANPSLNPFLVVVQDSRGDFRIHRSKKANCFVVFKTIWLVGEAEQQGFPSLPFRL